MQAVADPCDQGDDVDPAELATELADAYCRSRVNASYYGCKLARAQRWTLWLDVAVAIGTSGTVATLGVWRTEAGHAVLAMVASLATFVTVVRPILGLPERVARYSKLWADYSTVTATLERVTRDLRRHRGGAGRPTVEAVRSAVDAFARLEREGDSAPNRRLLDQCRRTVDRDAPAAAAADPSRI